MQEGGRRHKGFPERYHGNSSGRVSSVLAPCLLFGSLVGIIVLFIRTSTNHNKRHIDLVKTMLDDGKEERSEMTGRWVKSSDKLADAINELSKGLQGKNK